MRYLSIFTLLVAISFLASCAFVPGTQPEGPYQGCTYTPQTVDVECEYREVDHSKQRPTASSQEDDGVNGIPRPEPWPEYPRPLPPEDPEEDEKEQPDPPEHEQPPETPEDPDVPSVGPQPNPDDDCKPGYGHGDKNHCHSGPPGLE